MLLSFPVFLEFEILLLNFSFLCCLLWFSFKYDHQSSWWSTFLTLAFCNWAKYHMTTELMPWCLNHTSNHCFHGIVCPCSLNRATLVWVYKMFWAWTITIVLWLKWLSDIKSNPKSKQFAVTSLSCKKNMDLIQKLTKVKDITQLVSFKLWNIQIECMDLWLESRILPTAGNARWQHLLLTSTALHLQYIIAEPSAWHSKSTVSSMW